MRLRTEWTGERPSAEASRIPRWVAYLTSLMLLGGSLTSATSVAVRARADGNGRPNIVFILSDDQRFDSMWAMPTVKADLADKGVTLTNYFVTDPLCCPSRSSIMRGQYPHGTGVYNNDNGPYGGYPRFHEMGDDLSNVATWLQTDGYRTGLIGKFLNGYEDASIVPPGWDQWNALVTDHYYNFYQSINGTKTFVKAPLYQTDVLGQQAVDFIDSTPAEQPLFLYWAPHAPHAAAIPAPQDVGTFSWLPPYRPVSFNEPDVSDKPPGMQKPLLKEQQIANTDAFRERQYETLQDVDRWVGHIVDELSATGRLSNTLLVYTTDNGIMYGEHRLTMVKNTAYEPAIRSPFVARWDGVIPPGATDGRFALNIDLAPTFSDVAGATPTNEVDGSDLMPLLTRTVDPQWRRDFLIEHGGGAGVAPPFCAVRNDGAYLYVDYFATHEEELYDLHADPYEVSNVASEPAYSDVLRAIRDRVRQLCVPEPPLLSNQYAEPGQPVDVAAAPADGAATVTWSPPPADGGSPITGYTVTSDPDGVTVGVDGATTTATVEGLAGGGAYTFTVAATNAFGTSGASDPSNPVTVGDPQAPAAPTGVTAVPEESSAYVTWSPPPVDGGSPVTSYTVTSSPDDITATVDGNVTTATVEGLTDGETYTFTVTATNAIGTGPASDPSNPVIPGQARAPEAPTGAEATAGDQSAGVTWSPPVSDGGSPITSYVVTSSPDGVTATVDGTSTSATVQGLTDGTTYTFTVTASNDVGTGPASDPSNPVDPGPIVPTITRFDPAAARVGRLVTLTGTGFSSTQQVLFGGVSAAYQVVSDTELIATVPDGAVTAPISVVAPEGSVTTADPFGVMPHVESFDPVAGSVKINIHIHGTGFFDVTAVKIGDDQAHFKVISYWFIRAVVPHDAVSGPVSVVTSAGRAKTTAWFTVEGPPRPRGGIRFRA